MREFCSPLYGPQVSQVESHIGLVYLPAVFYTWNSKFAAKYVKSYVASKVSIDYVSEKPPVCCLFQKIHIIAHS